MNNSKQLLLGLAQYAIAAVDGERLVERAASRCELPESLHLVAIGKAALAMSEGAGKVLGDRIRRAFMITARAYDSGRPLGLPELEILFGGHPVPTRESLCAGMRLLQWIEATPEDGSLLFLISGGASSMLEVLEEGITLADLQRVNRWLLGSGLGIDRINAVRRGLSRIKGGKLLHYLGDRHADVWLLSDVPGDDPAVIGSGLLYPCQNTAVCEDAYPGWLKALLARLVVRQDKGGQVSHPRVPVHRVLGNLAGACEGAAAQARRQGFFVQLHATELDGDAESVGRRLGFELETALSGIHIWGGETTVRLPADAGRGGRNQHLALAAALQLAGRKDVQLLALATDGRDGPGDDAGALVDGGTIYRGELAGLDAVEHLRRADSGRFLEASGDLVSTGPTGTNVRDLILAWKA